MGITEHEFWSMTLAELGRSIESKKRVMKDRAKEKASYDYILANLIGISVSRIYDKNAKLPEITTVYPTLFDSAELQEQKQKKQDELSAARFKQFANSFNKRFEKGGGQK